MRRPSVPVTLLLGAVVGTAALAGCGSGDDASATRDRRDGRTAVTVDPSGRPGACELLTRADVEAAVGEPVAPGPQSTDECWWSTASDLKTVNLIRRTGDLATWRSGYDNDFWVPNDLGDEGYSGKVLDSIVWRIGDTQYEINVVYSTKGDPARVVRTLAEQADARL